LTSSGKIPLQSLLNPKYGYVLCYPKFSSEVAEARIQELASINVSELEFTGGKKIGEADVLGKGCVGIVVVAHQGSRRVALKIRRVDADRSSMFREAKMLEVANKVGVGPKFYAVTQNFLLMEFVEGKLIPVWADELQHLSNFKKPRILLLRIMEDCFKLDRIGLDHGELTNASKHIIIAKDDVPKIMDFETASMERKTSNLTSICQYLFLRSGISATIAKVVRFNEEDLVEALRAYKKEQNTENFKKVAKVLGLLDFDTENELSN